MSSAIPIIAPSCSGGQFSPDARNWARNPSLTGSAVAVPVPVTNAAPANTGAVSPATQRRADISQIYGDKPDVGNAVRTPFISSGATYGSTVCISITS